MFDFFHYLFTGHDAHDFPAIGDFQDHCSVMTECPGTRISMIKPGLISIPKTDLSSSSDIQTLKPVKFETHTKPIFLTPEGPSVNTGFKGKVFSFTGRVDPGEGIIDGVRIDWSAPPDIARILVSPYPSSVGIKNAFHDATGWFSTKANGQMVGSLKQSQNVIFSHPELVKRIDIQMKDFESSSKSQFGIEQIGLVAHQNEGEGFNATTPGTITR